MKQFPQGSGSKNKDQKNNITTQNAAKGRTTAKTIHTEARVSALTAPPWPTPLLVAAEHAAHPPQMLWVSLRKILPLCGFTYIIFP